MNKSFTPFRSKFEGMQRAKRFHVCMACKYNSPETFKFCPVCNSTNRQHFASKTEFHRGMMLLTLRSAGTLDRLRFQPQYDLTVNGQKVGVYVADAEYYMDGKLVVEDSKPEKFMDNLAKLKMKLFQAIYGITVTIPQRETGNISSPK